MIHRNLQNLDASMIVADDRNTLKYHIGTVQAEEGHPQMSCVTGIGCSDCTEPDNTTKWSIRSICDPSVWTCVYINLVTAPNWYNNVNDTKVFTHLFQNGKHFFFFFPISILQTLHRILIRIACPSTYRRNFIRLLFIPKWKTTFFQFNNIDISCIDFN